VTNKIIAWWSYCQGIETAKPLASSLPLGLEQKAKIRKREM
jgi:hypothetical protein